MDISYIRLARINRTKALASLRNSRGHFAVLSEDTIQFKQASRTVLPHFFSARPSGAITHAHLH